MRDDPLWRTEHDGPRGAPVAVLVHGSMDRSTSFAKVARRLHELTIVRYDRRGYGRSLAAGPAVSIDQQVDDLLAILAGRAATVAGHSLGGVIALAASQRAPELVHAVVVYEAPMPWRSWWPADSAGGNAMAMGAEDPELAARAAEMFMRRIVGEDIWERLPRSTKDQRRAEGAALVADLRSMRDAADPPYEPASVNVPVVAAHGARSVPYHIRAVQTLAAEAPHGELHVVDGASHGVHTSDPGAFAELVRRGVELAARSS
jgi:pimeloyl-ACP methyl ester carboxylesterase